MGSSCEGGTEYGKRYGKQALSVDSQLIVRRSPQGKRRFWSGYRSKYRDSIRRVALGVNFAVVGIESQEEVNYLMSLRTMEYDAAEYSRQAEQIRRKVRGLKDISRAEFLSGFGKEDRLQPCVTVVLYFGDHWDGSEDLHGILDFRDIPEELQKLVNNYRIFVVEVKKLEDTEVFRTDIRQLFDFIRCSGDKERLQRLIEQDPAYREVDEAAYEMMSAYGDAGELLEMKKYKGKDGKINMCQGLLDWMEESRQQGIEAGMEAGRIEGMETGRIEGMELGEKRFAALTQILLQKGRMEDLGRAVVEKEYRESLYEEFGL